VRCNCLACAKSMCNFPLIDRGNGGFTWWTRRVPRRDQPGFDGSTPRTAHHLLFPRNSDWDRGKTCRCLPNAQVSAIREQHQPQDVRHHLTRHFRIPPVRFRDRNAPIPRSGCRNAMRSGGSDMGRGETWFPRLLVIVKISGQTGDDSASTTEVGQRQNQKNTLK